MQYSAFLLFVHMNTHRTGIETNMTCKGVDTGGGGAWGASALPDIGTCELWNMWIYSFSQNQMYLFIDALH